MPNLTTNYSLKKPIKATENGDIDVLNGNFDIIDTELKSNLEYATTEIESLKSSVNSGKDSVYSAIVGKKVTPISKDFVALVGGINSIKLGQGNAIESDVVSPKTFTNSDGILRTGNATIESLGGKRFASGNAYDSFVVAGLPFKPKYISFAFGDQYTTSYGTLGEVNTNYAFQQQTTSGGGRYIGLASIDYSVKITNDGFTTTVNIGKWFAIG